jgi:quercetin dioxygenase-like cupin family protein
VTILRITIAPGTALPEHKHPFMNAGVLIRGRLLVRKTSGETFQLEAGDSISEVVETWHYGSNNGDEPAEILVVYAGVEGQPVTVLKSEAERH